MAGHTPGETLPDYAISPDTMRDGIRLWLDPVLKELHRLDGQVGGAHDTVSAAHGSNAAGWFGSGPAGADVHSACSGFLNEMTIQLHQLAQDHADLTESLQTYRDALENHIKWAEQNEKDIAHSFHAIHNSMDAGGN